MTIAKLYPKSAGPKEEFPSLGWHATANVAAVLALADAVAPGLLVVDTTSFADFVSAKATISDFIQNARAHGSSTPSLKSENLTILRCVLEQCPDQVITRSDSSPFFRVRLRFAGVTTQ